MLLLLGKHHLLTWVLSQDLLRVLPARVQDS